jgi:N-acetylneuraminic acid mutarotase
MKSTSRFLVKCIATARMRIHGFLCSAVVLPLTAAYVCGAGAASAVSPSDQIPACLKISGQHTEGHDAWSPVASMTTRRYLFAAATGCDGGIYAIGGIADSGEQGGSLDTGLTGSVEKYDPGKNIWTSVASLPTPRAGLGAATGPDGRIYAIGGSPDESFGASDTVEVYDPQTDVWETAAPLPVPLDDVNATSDSSGHIYALGSQATETYDPIKDVWTTAPPVSGDRSRMVVAAGLDGKIYAFGGYGGDGPVSRAQAYDPRTGKWSDLPSMPVAMGQGAGATGVDGRIYVMGGDESWDNSNSSHAFAYNPRSSSWVEISPLPEGRNNHAAALGADGRILIMGGDTGTTEQVSGITSSVIAYTP